MPVAARTSVVIAFPAARVRRLPARQVPVQAPAVRRPVPAADRRAARQGGRAAGMAGVAAMLLALSGAVGWGFVSAERGVQARLAAFASAPAPAAGYAASSGAGALTGTAWARR